MRVIDGGVSLDVWVVPGAAQTAIAGIHDGALRIRVAAPPERGRANHAVAGLLARSTGGRVDIVGGHGTRRKTIEIRGVTPGDVRAALGFSGSE